MDYKIISTIGLGAVALRSLMKSRIINSQERESGLQEPDTFSNTFDARLDDYISDEYGITMKYPSSWNKNPRYENKYEGVSGFFEVSGFEGNENNIDAAVEEQINEPYLPYGTNPTIRRLTIDGQPAREIIPSADQGKIITDREVALVVQYKTPAIVDGVSYPYLIIWTNKENLPLVIRSLRFLRPNTTTMNM